MALRPPITLMGSKARWARKIIDSFPAHNCFCEPFAGTGAILLAKKPSGIEVYNDVNMELVNLFRVVSVHPPDHPEYP